MSTKFSDILEVRRLELQYVRGLIKSLASSQVVRRNKLSTPIMDRRKRSILQRDKRDVQVKIAYLHHILDAQNHADMVSGADTSFSEYLSKRFIKFRYRLSRELADIDRKYHGSEV